MRSEQGSWAGALHYRIKVMKIAMAEHWALSEKIGKHPAQLSEAILAAKTLGVGSVEDLQEVLAASNWAKHAPPPGMTTMPLMPKGACVAREFEVLRELLYSGQEDKESEERVHEGPLVEGSMEVDFDTEDKVVEVCPGGSRPQGASTSDVLAAEKAMPVEGQDDLLQDVFGDDGVDELKVRFRPWRWPRPAATKITTRTSGSLLDGQRLQEALQDRRTLTSQLDRFLREVFGRFDADECGGDPNLRLRPWRWPRPVSTKTSRMTTASCLDGLRLQVALQSRRAQDARTDSMLREVFGRFEADEPVAATEQARGEGLFGDGSVGQLAESPNLRGMLLHKPSWLK